MRTTLRHITPLLVAGAGSLAMALAPIASAAPTPQSDPGSAQTTCNNSGPGTECQTPGNVQINDSMPPDFEPQYPMFSLYGYGHGYGGGHR